MKKGKIIFTVIIVICGIKRGEGSFIYGGGGIRTIPAQSIIANTFSLDLWSRFSIDRGYKEILPGPFSISIGGSYGLTFSVYGDSCGKPSFLYQGENYNMGFGILWTFMREKKKVPYFGISFRAGSVLSGWDTEYIVYTGKHVGNFNIRGGGGYLNVIDTTYFPRSSGLLFLASDFRISHKWRVEAEAYSAVNGEKNILLINSGIRYFITPYTSLGVYGEGGLTSSSPDFSIFLTLRLSTYKEGEIDTDGDGVLDIYDLCPEEKEDRDGFEDDDGCPDYDNDKDGIPDEIDPTPFGEKEWQERKKYKTPVPEMKIKGPSSFLRKPERKTAHLFFQITHKEKPISGKIYVDKEVYQYKPSMGMLEIEVPEGKHNVRVVAKGMRQRREIVNVKAGETLFYRFDMVKIPYGAVMIKVKNYLDEDIKDVQVYALLKGGVKKN